MKKIWNVFYSMKCGMALLGYLVVASVIATILPGGEWVFRSWVFVLPACALGLNLFLCSVKRFPELLGQMRTAFVLGEGPRLNHELKDSGSFTAIPIPVTSGLLSADAVFDTVGMRVREKKQIGPAKWSYGFRYRFGIWGSWVCHLGMLILLIGVVLGQFMVQSTYLYGVVGEEKLVNGTQIAVAVEDFSEQLWPDGTARQYRTLLTVTNTVTGEAVCEEIQVNQPMTAFGLDFLQSGSGWAVTMEIYQGLTKVGSGLLCEGEAIEMTEGRLQLQLEPEEVHEKESVLCSFYYDGALSHTKRVKLGEVVSEGEYQFVFREPQRYTMIQIVSDPTEGVVLVGALLLLLGVAVAFLCRPQELWVKEENGQLVVFGKSRRDGGRFAAQLREKLRLHR